MSPTAAARTSQASAPSLRDRLKDPSLLRDRCYIDGAWVGTPSRPVTNPVNGVELAKVPVMSTTEATEAVEAAELRSGDQLLLANDKPVHSAYDWVFAINFPGGWIEVLRDGQRVRIEGFSAGALGISIATAKRRCARTAPRSASTPCMRRGTATRGASLTPIPWHVQCTSTWLRPTRSSPIMGSRPSAGLGAEPRKRSQLCSSSTGWRLRSSVSTLPKI